MTSRNRLPNRRASENLTFVAPSGTPMTANVGYYPDGRIGEVFLVSSGKSGSDLNIAMLEISTAVSIALQHGADINEMRKAFPRTEDGRPEGPIGKLLDLLARKEPNLEVVS
jgi:hypothetical protein